MIKNQQKPEKTAHSQMKTAPERGRAKGKLLKPANRTVPAAAATRSSWLLEHSSDLCPGNCFWNVASDSPGESLFPAHCSTAAGQKSRRERRTTNAERRTQNCPKYTNWPGMSYWWSRPWNERPQLLASPKTPQLTGWQTDWPTGSVSWMWEQMSAIYQRRS